MTGSAARVAISQEFQTPYSGFSDTSTAFPFGAALDGFGVVVSAGHGWEGGPDGGYQRSRYAFDGCGTCDGITEDIYNAELVTDYLIPMLRGAGARVYVVRESDRAAVSVEVDDVDPGYSETGTWADGANTELGWELTYRTHSVTYPGSAKWSFQVPAEGDYEVQARWSAGSNRCQEVRYTVSHSGGAFEFVVNQQVDGSMWVPLGRLHFPAGIADITVDAPSGVGCYLIADAVKLGGGVDAESGHPWWQVGAFQWLAATGPASLSSYNEVTVRPALANYVGADFYVSIHADASDTASVVGTSTYRYNCGSGVWYESLDPAECDMPSGSAGLQYAIQAQFINDVRAGWDSTWANRGNLVGDYGELRILEGIPGALFESAFFTNVTTGSGARMSNNQAMHDPRFRRIAARAVARAIITAANSQADFPPEPPTRLYLRDDAGTLTASWHAVDGALGYRVYVALDGRGYDGGRVVASTSLVLDDVPDGTVALVRVSALNAGGESTPSAAVAASAVDGGPRVLLVNAFDRLDAWVREDFNHRDYSIEHGMALSSAGIGFDGALDEAVTTGDVSVGGYAMMDWILGRESTESVTLDATAQSIIAGFLDDGGCMFASGTEIAWDLDHLGSAADKAFMTAAFGAGYAGDDAGTRSVMADPGGAFAGLPDFFFDDGTAGVYDARYPDLFTVLEGGSAALNYASGGVAAVTRAQGAGRSVIAGFPFETVVGIVARDGLMAAVCDFCGISAPVVADDPVVADEIVIVEEPVVEADTPDVIDVRDAGGQSDTTEPDAAVGVDAPDVVDAGNDPAIDALADSYVPFDAGRETSADKHGADMSWLADLPSGDAVTVDSSGEGGSGCSTGVHPGGGHGVLVLLLLCCCHLVFRVRRCA